MITTYNDMGPENKFEIECAPNLGNIIRIYLFGLEAVRSDHLNPMHYFNN